MDWTISNRCVQRVSGPCLSGKFIAVASLGEEASVHQMVLQPQALKGSLQKICFPESGGQGAFEAGKFAKQRIIPRIGIPALIAQNAVEREFPLCEAGEKVARHETGLFQPRERDSGKAGTGGCLAIQKIADSRPDDRRARESVEIHCRAAVGFTIHRRISQRLG